MGRITYGYEDDPSAGLWLGTAKRAINGKRGQALLREIEAALLAMPEHRLIAGAVCREGEVCVLGALAVYRERRFGQLFPAAMATVARRFYSDEYSSDDVADTLGVTRTLGWLLMEQNDEVATSATPEERWVRLLTWVQRNLRSGEGR